MPQSKFGSVVGSLKGSLVKSDSSMYLPGGGAGNANYTLTSGGARSPNHDLSSLNKDEEYDLKVRSNMRSTQRSIHHPKRQPFTTTNTSECSNKNYYVVSRMNDKVMKRLDENILNMMSEKLENLHPNI